MRKSTKFFAVLSGLFLMATGAMAQKRCDLGVTITKPAAGATIQYKDTMWLEFKISNSGPDAMTPLDTIYFAAGGGVFFVNPAANIPSGGSANFDPGLYIVNTRTADEDVNVCVNLISQENIYRMNGTDTVWATVTYIDNNHDNDESCATARFLKAVSITDMNGIAQQSLSIYPNPATTDVRFNLSLEKAENVVAIIKDVTGREVMRNDFGRIAAGQEQSLQLNIGQLHEGMYFVEVVAGEQKAVGKITVKH